MIQGCDVPTQLVVPIDACGNTCIIFVEPIVHGAGTKVKCAGGLSSGVGVSIENNIRKGRGDKFIFV
jgi:hypothetical protein